MVSSTFQEGYVELEFGSSWSVVPWDRHAGYRNGLLRNNDSRKAVDFLALQKGTRLFLLELTDYRVPSTRPNHAVAELAAKVCDTVAGLVGAARQEQHADELAPYLRVLSHPSSEVVVVLWIELGRFANRLGAKAGRAPLIDDLKRRIKWLGARALVESLDSGVSLEDIRVRNLPGAGQAGRRRARGGRPPGAKMEPRS